MCVGNQEILVLFHQKNDQAHEGETTLGLNLFSDVNIALYRY